jgi:uncharacterized protein YceK
MPRFFPSLALVFPVVVLFSGCGTVANITAPTTPSSGYRAFGPTACEPFGGVQRSVMVGSAPLMAGPIGIIPAAIAVGVDAPLSLVGDVLTLPIVYYRLNNHWQGIQANSPDPAGNGQQTPPSPEVPVTNGSPVTSH